MDICRDIVEVDGSLHEGGGQILRLASSLSVVRGIPIHMTKIRAGRKPKEGLRAQHLSGLEITRDICNGHLTGGQMDSTEITFKPAKVIGGTMFKDVKTAGSVCLLMQSVLPCALFGSEPSIITLRGGTNADHAPPVDFMNEVFKKVSKRFGVEFDLKLNIRGFFPMGGGEVVLRIPQLKSPLKAVHLIDQGDIKVIRGVSFVAGKLNQRMARMMADGAERALRNAFGRNVSIEITSMKEPDNKAFGNCAAINLWCETSTGCILGSNCLGKRGVESEDVGRLAATDLIEDIQSGSCVDRYMQDQMIVLMALAQGKSVIRTNKLTAHTETAIHTCELLTKVKFTTTKDAKSNTIILECEGISAVP